MKIAQIAPLAECCPPKLYGGTERIVSYLTEELVRQGHDVTLFASGDSQTAAHLVSCSAMALRLDPTIEDRLPYYVMMLDKVRQRAHEFDVLHFHIDLMHYPLFREMKNRIVTTLHGRLNLPDLQPFYEFFSELPLVSISNDQRQPMPPVNWAATVLHGLPSDLLMPMKKPRNDYLAFLGRICPEKRPDRAIEIAMATGMPLKIAAKVDPADEEYWQSYLKPLVDSAPNIEFVGEINEQQKSDFLGHAQALLFPIDWPEPFGLVMIEAMACGTPVIAFKCGSVPEVIDEGVTGFIVSNVQEAADAVRKTVNFDRARVRATFEKRFTVERMAKDYLDIYRNLISQPDTFVDEISLSAEIIDLREAG
ncbi:glycosyltransferase family 4 protein [Kozakia baliensis]|uniref:glycosyltransferase family 4 protein n=1 Tax=Kozakia baliensis TaxID=153496 RepID=UPI00345B7971